MNNYSPVLKKTTAEIAKDIVEAYNNSTGVFINKVNAEDLLPETTIENQIQFLFWVLQMDYSTKSSLLYQHANEFWKEDPKWITTKFIREKNEIQLREIIKRQLHPRYPNEILIRFQLNAKKLEEEYDSSAVNLIKKSSNAKDLYKRIREFRGFGPKLGNFLTRTYIDVLDLKYPDIADILPPVDTHDVRLTFEWDIIDSKKMTQKRIEKVQHIWSKACKDTNVSWITFDKALWLIGSEGVRSGNPAEDYAKNLGQRLD